MDGGYRFVTVGLDLTAQRRRIAEFGRAAWDLGERFEAEERAGVAAIFFMIGGILGVKKRRGLRALSHLYVMPDVTAPLSHQADDASVRGRLRVTAAARARARAPPPALARR